MLPACSSSASAVAETSADVTDNALTFVATHDRSGTPLGRYPVAAQPPPAALGLLCRPVPRPSALGVSAPRASPRHAAKPPLHTTRQYRYVVEVVSRENLEKVLDTILDCSPLGGSLVILDIFFDAIM